MPLTLLPHAEALAVQYLLTVDEVTALVGQRIYTALPTEPVYPLVTLYRIGGIVRVRGWFDQARLQVEAWANTKSQARSVAATVQAAMQAMPGTHSLGVVTAVVEDLGLTWSPDPVSNKARYIRGDVVYSHPAP